MHFELYGIAVTDLGIREDFTQVLVLYSEYIKVKPAAVVELRYRTEASQPSVEEVQTPT